MSTSSIVESGLFKTTESVQKAQSAQKKELGQDEFLMLMLEQIKNQDPFKPMENGDFLAQMAQFSTVNGITDMQTALEDMVAGFQSSQVLQASSLVGKQVVVPSDTFNYVEGTPIQASVDLPSYAQNVSVEFLNQNGALIKKVNLGEASAGELNFSFDGLDDSGQQIPSQKVEMRASFFNGVEQESLPTRVLEKVSGVSLSQGGALLSVDNVGQMPLGDVVSIKE